MGENVSRASTRVNSWAQGAEVPNVAMLAERLMIFDKVHMANYARWIRPKVTYGF